MGLKFRFLIKTRVVEFGDEVGSIRVSESGFGLELLGKSFN